MTRMTLRTILCALGALLLLAGSLPAQNGDLDRFDRAVRRLVEKVAPSVVSVRVVAIPDPVEGTTAVHPVVRRTLARASGIVSGPDGEITTVLPGGLPEWELEEGERIRIEVELHDGRAFPAAWRGHDDETGLALLSLSAPRSDLETLVPVRDARTTPDRGQTVVAIGATGFALGHVAHPARGIRHAGGSFPRGILTSIEANPGDIGGLLANPAGELVGLLAFSVVVDPRVEPDRRGDGASGEQRSRTEATTREAALGRAVAIPADLVRRMLADLREHGTFRRGALGATFQFHHPALAGPTHYGAGALVRNIVAEGEAERGGLRVGDVIQSVEGREIRRAEDLLWFRERVEYGTIDSVLPLRVARMEEKRVVSRTLRVRVGARPDGTSGDRVQPPPAPDFPTGPIPVPGGGSAAPGGAEKAPPPRVGPKPPRR